MACVLHSHHLAISRVETNAVFSHGLAVFCFQSYGAFSCLQSRVHELWARFFGSSLGDAPRYTPSDCFETFPFPASWVTNTELEIAGKRYYEFRSDLMTRRQDGLTDIYNMFNSPEENCADILRIRELHAAMDRMVLDAYGWRDIPIACEFLLDYEVDEFESDGKKKPWRYRWPDDVRDEILARLLELNAQRAKEEARSGVSRTRVRPANISKSGVSVGGKMKDLFS